jgi:hypothetical protein
MPQYISSDANRFYVATEASYGIPAQVQPANRFQAVRLRCHQSQPNSRRRDKTGARTYLGGTPTAPRISSFEVSMNLGSWDQATAPSYGPFVQAAMGGAPELIAGLVVGSASGAQLQTQSAHGLSVGSAIANGAEIRFVTTVVDPLTVIVNVPFSISPSVGSILATSSGYKLGTQLPSLSVYDYWDPSSGVSRLLAGIGVDRFQIEVKGDFHELTFSGPAADLLDSCSAAFGVSGITSFPAEPPLAEFDYSIVSGQLGEVWLGSPLNQVFTLTEALVEIRNNLLTRTREFGSSYPMAIVPGPREVITSFTCSAQDDSNTTSLYAAAKTRMPISAMLQLGQQPGQIMAVYLPNVVPELPLYDDSESYLLWEFRNSVSQGVANDEAYVAFG